MERPTIKTFCGRDSNKAVMAGVARPVGVLEVLELSIGFYQVLASFSTLNVEWSSGLGSILRSSSISTGVSWSEVPGVACLVR
eukprot:3856425-Rhodomonas_salina.1